MKSIAILLFSMLILGNVFADEIPSRLPEGAYKMECWGYRVQMPDGETKLQRTAYNTKGSAIVISQDNKTIVKTTMSSNEGGMTSTDSDITTSNYEKLSDGLFKEISESKSNSTFDGQTYSNSQKWVRTFRIADQGFEYSISIKNNDEPEKPGFGELVTQTMPDGRIVMQNYIREKFSRSKRESTSGGYIPGSQVFQSSDTCIYTPAK